MAADDALPDEPFAVEPSTLTEAVRWSEDGDGFSWKLSQTQDDAFAEAMLDELRSVGATDRR